VEAEKCLSVEAKEKCLLVDLKEKFLPVKAEKCHWVEA
jgi:hypothetical protein